MNKELQILGLRPYWDVVRVGSVKLKHVEMEYPGGMEGWFGDKAGSFNTCASASSSATSLVSGARTTTPKLPHQTEPPTNLFRASLQENSFT